MASEVTEEVSFATATEVPVLLETVDTGAPVLSTPFSPPASSGWREEQEGAAASASPSVAAPAPAVATEAAEEEEAEDESTSSASKIINLKKLSRGWGVFSAMVTKTYEEQVRPAMAVAAEKTAKFHEETVKPALAVAAAETAKFNEEKLKPAWEVTKEKSAVAWEVTKEKSAVAWEVTKAKSAELHEKIKPTLDECSTQCDLGVKSLVAMIGGKTGPVVAAPGSSSDDEGSAPSVLDSSTKGSFTI